MTPSSPRTLLNVVSSLLYALLLRIALLSLTGVRADSIIGNYDSISSGATIVKSDTQCTFSSTLRLVLYNGRPTEGTPQVLYKGEWCTIQYLDMNAAQVFCTAIGMGDAVSNSISRNSNIYSYGKQLGSYYCEGTESTLEDCQLQCCWNDGYYTNLGSKKNPNTNDATVECSHPVYNIDGCTSGYVITTAAGTGNSTVYYNSGSQDATSADLYNPYGLAFDSSGNMYIADTQKSVIRKVDTSGALSTFAGTGTAGYSGDGDSPASTSTKINNPKGVTVDSSGNVYIADSSNNVIRKVESLTPPSSCTVALKSYQGSAYEGTVLVRYNGVWSTIYGYSGFWYNNAANVVCNQLGMGNANSYSSGNYGYSYGNQLYGYACQGSESTLQDCSQQSYYSYSYDNNGQYVNSYSYIYRKGSANNGNYGDATVKCSHASTASSPCVYGAYNTSTIAGTGTSGSAVDGSQAISSSLNNPIGVAVDSSGNVYVADGGNNRIRKITKSTGIINTYAGGGASLADGVAATSTTLSSTIGICVGGSDNMYIADGGNNLVRKVTKSSGIISTIAGTGASGFSGDNGPATSAKLSNPSGVAVYVSSSYPQVVTVYIADTGNNRIRQVSMSTLIITTIAGTGTSGYSGDNGPPTSAKLNGPTGIAVNGSTGDIYVADNGNKRIRKIFYYTSAPSSSLTFAPSSPHLISFPLLMSVNNWPFDYAPAESEQAITTLVVDIAGTSNVNVNLTISENNSQRRRLLSSYSLSVVANITTTSSSASAINKKFMDSMNTKKLISALSAACGCSDYNGISISFLSAEDYCIDKNTPTELCSYGHIKMSPYLTAVRNYSFEETYVEGVDFGDCAMLEEIEQYAFYNAKIQELDLLACTKLHSIRYNTFANNEITKIKLPKSIEKIDRWAFRSNPIEEIWCEAPLDAYTVDSVARYCGEGCFVMGCYGYNADYIFYPSVKPSTMAKPFLVTVGTVFICLYTAIYTTSPQPTSLTLLGISLLAIIDLFSDLIDVFLCLFASTELFWISFLLVLILPIVYFTYAVVVCQRIVPHLVYDFYESCLDRTMSNRDKRNESNSACKVLMAPLFAISVVFMFPYYLALLVIGAFLYHTKLLAHRDVWNTWVYLYTGRLDIYGKKSMVDAKLLNDAMFLQMLLTSLPMLLVKIANFMQNEASRVFNSKEVFNFYGSQLVDHPAYIFIWSLLSLLISALYCIVGIYRYVYVANRYKYAVQDVPFTDFLLTITPAVGLLDSREDIKYNQEAIVPYRKYWRDRLLQHKLDSTMHDVMHVVVKQFFKDEKVGQDLNLLLHLRVILVEAILETKDEMMCREESAPVDMHQLADEVFHFLLKESEDLSIYKALVAANIRDSTGLLDTDEATIKTILNALPNKSHTYNLVLSYLNLITYNNLMERRREALLAEDEADSNEKNNQLNGDNEKLDLEANIVHRIESSYDLVDFDTPFEDATAIESGSKEVINDPSVRKVVNRSGDIDKQDESGVSASNNTTADSGNEVSSPYATIDTVIQDLQENSDSDAVWSAPKATKKGWFRRG